MPATIIATVAITDPAKLAEYRQNAADALAKHGGKVIAAGKLGAALEGTALTGDTAAIITFETPEDAKNWRNDPKLVDIHALRNAAGTSSITLIE